MEVEGTYCCLQIMLSVVQEHTMPTVTMVTVGMVYSWLHGMLQMSYSVICDSLGIKQTK